MDARDRQNAAKPIQHAPQPSELEWKDWKEKTVEDVASTNIVNPETEAEKALKRSQIIADMGKVNDFLASHVNRRTEQYDQPFSETEWLAMPREHQQKQLAVVESVLKSEELRRQSHIADAQGPVRREPLTANPFATTKERKAR